MLLISIYSQLNPEQAEDVKGLQAELEQTDLLPDFSTRINLGNP
jgi:hypothetical protein